MLNLVVTSPQQPVFNFNPVFLICTIVLVAIMLGLGFICVTALEHPTSTRDQGMKVASFGGLAILVLMLGMYGPTTPGGALAHFLDDEYGVHLTDRQARVLYNSDDASVRITVEGEKVFIAIKDTARGDLPINALTGQPLTPRRD